VKGEGMRRERNGVDGGGEGRGKGRDVRD